LSDVTRILESIERGDPKAADELLPLSLAQVPACLRVNGRPVVIRTPLGKLFCAFGPGISHWLTMSDFAQKLKLKPGAVRLK
jgi:hypothetical protein